MRYGYLWSAALFLTISSLTGCGSSPRETYYTLSAGAAVNGATSASGESAYSIAVGPITLPEVVDRPQFVLRAGPNEVSIVELHRWAGPLRSEIPRIIADNLAADLNVKRVAAYPQSAGDNADYRRPRRHPTIRLDHGRVGDHRCPLDRQASLRWSPADRPLDGPGIR